MKRFLLLLLFLLSTYFGFAQADIKVLNTNFQTKYVPGSEVVYTISVINLGPATATNVNVSSLISNGISQKAWTGPANVDIVTGAIVNSNGSGEINHSIGILTTGQTIGTLNSGQMVSYIMTIKVPLGFTGNLNCKVTATSTTMDSNPANNVVTDTDTKGIDADISVTNTNNQLIYTPGTTTTYTVKVTNNGPLNAGGVVVTNTIPAGITSYSWTGDNGSSGTDVPLNNTIGTLVKGKTITYTITAQIPAGFVGNLINTVSASSPTMDNTPANNSAIDKDVVANSGANLVVVNTDGVATYSPGTQKTYTVTVTNSGPNPATNVVVTNPIPVGITSFSWTGSNGSSGTNVALNNTLPTLANGASVTYTITLNIPNNFIGNLVSEASATSATPDYYPECPQCIDTDTLKNETDIMVTNTNNQLSYFPSGTSVYTVTVKNNGPKFATNVLVNNPIPAGITGFSWTGNGANGTNVALNNTISNLAPGQSVVYTITMQIPAAFTGNLTSIATANSSVPDGNTLNNSASDTDTLGQEADVVITTTNNQAIYVPGGTSTYTITVTNNGPLNATNVLVENAIPAGIVSSSWSGNGATGTDVNLSNTITNLQSGQSVVYTLVLQIPTTLTGNLVSTATATTSVPDTTTVNNTASDTDTLATNADIQITSTNNQISYVPGGTSVYTVTVINNGPLNATNVLVNSAIPAGITNFSWTGNGANGTNVTLNNTILTLASGASVVYTITMQIPAAFTGNLTSTATANGAEADADSSNNSATDTDTLGQEADVVITNTDNQTSYLPGGTTTYTITVTNNGPLNATNILVENALPVGIVSSSWSGNGASGTDVGLSNTIANLQPGQSVVYTVILQIPVTFTGDLISTATATSSVTDTNTLNNTATDTDTFATEADIQITHTNNQVSYISGGTSVYTVTVTNNGLIDATNVLVNSAIPAGITSFSWTGNGANGTNVNLNNTILTLASGASVVYTITMQIPLTLTGNLVSTATANGAEPDNNTSNNTATDTDTLGVGADIVITNTNNQVEYIPGTTSVYTITVTNNGPLNAVNVVVTNPVPAGIITSSWTGDNGSSGTNTGLVNAIPLLTVGSTITYTFTMVVPVGFNADIVSVAGVTSDTTDPNPNCEACVDTDILLLPLADLVTTITDNSATYRAGDPRIYTITITNNGPSDAENVVVQGNVSSGVPLSNISWSGSGGGFTMGYLNDVISTLANGASVTYIVYVEVPSGYSQTENLIANVSVTSDATDPNPGCTNCIDIDTPNPNADIVVYKTNNQTQFLLNEPTVYTITVRNDGASDAVNVVVNDAVPPGIPAEKMSWVSSIGTSGIGAISDLIPNLANGEIVIYKVTVQVPQFMSSITGNLINTVNVTSGTSEFNINNNNSTDVDTPRSDFVTVDSQSYSTTIDGVSGPERLIKNILINEPCVQLSNFSASAPISFGYFHRNNSVFPFKEGIIIRSGIAKNTEGKYTGVGTTSVGSNTSDADLQVIMNANGLTSQNRDASFVKFSFVPTVEDFSFNFLFASEEYGTYQCSTSFVDTFAFILTNTVTGVSQNLAVVPGTTPPTLISVVKIKKAIFNAGCGDLNPQYFGRYNAANIGPAPVGPASSAINLKGQTVSMVASANVIPNTLYSIKLVIGDAGDTALDSAVFLEAGSFNIGGPKITGSGIYASNEDFSGSSAFCAGTPRIIRAGTAPNPNVVYSWRKDDVLLVGETSYELEVSESGIYTVVFTYPNPDPNAVACQQTDDIVVEFKPTDFPMDEANDLYACNDATPTFNLTVNEPIVMANYDQFDFDTYYFTSLEAAQDPLGVPIPSSQLTTYAGADGQQIWMKMVNIFSGGNCDPVETFKLYLTTAPSGTLSYAEDGGEPGFCSGSSSILPPVAPDLTVGGTYSALPAGLTINPNTGAIDLSTSLVGTYTVTYEFSGQGCDPFTTTTQVEVIFCGATVASNSGNVCEGAATFDLFATDAGTGSTYEWSDYNGVPFSTDQNPVGIAVPTTAGAYIYTVVATINGVPTPPSSTTLTVHPIPTATFSAVSPICTNTPGTITFTGTPGAIVNFTDGTTNYSTTIDGTGNGEFTTPNLPVDTTFTLVDVTGDTVPACTGTLSGSLIIEVGLPEATIIGFTNSESVICSGTGTGLEIQGTPNSIVSYTKGGVAQPDVTLSSTGTATIDTGIQTETSTTTYIYALTNVVSDSTPPCSDAITGETATLTVNALPTATFTAAGASVCEGTTGTLNFIGTPNATITYNDGIQDLTTILDNTGVSAVTTAAISAATTYTLVSAEVTNTVLCSNTLTGTVTITIDENPVITTQPVGTTSCINGTVTFSVVATGANLTYQWFKGLSAITSATNASYTIASVTAASAGDYTVVVTGSCGTPVTSSIATLTVTQETLITAQPQPSTTVCVGQPINLSVTATGVNLTYQWFQGTVSLSGETNPTLTFASATSANAGTYTVVITNSCQVVTSANAVVIVNELPVIVTQPIGTTICEGQGISLSVAATGTGLTYQWFRNGTTNPIAGATAATYTDASVTLAEAGNYTVSVSGVCTPAVTSSIAVINVNQTATFTQQPVANTTVCVGGAITLTVATTGGTGVSYQWFKGTTPIPGAIATTYTIASSVVADAGNYTCVVTVASCGTITSNVANVVVNELPAITTQPIGTTICEGQGISLSVTATGTGLTYQWYRNGTIAIPSATSATYADASVSLAEAGNYTVRVSGACTPAVTSSIAVINVNQTATITQQPAANTIVCVGSVLTLSVATTGGTGVSYQWFKGANPITGATSTTYTIASSVVADAGSYTCIVTVASCGTITSNVANVVVNELPAITMQPIGTTICEGEGISLSVTATGTGLTYQWFRNGTIAITGATSATYADASVSLAEAGNYTVRVSGACTPAVTSSIAVINVNQTATFTQQPAANTTVCSGETVTLTVATTGGTGVSYQWFKGSTAIAGATSTTYTIASSVVADSGSYTCVVTVASCGTKTSNAAVVVVNQAPAITTQPQGKVICVGETATFTVAATGTNLTYQWYKGTTIIPSATSNTYTITNTVVADSGNYYCTIKSASCPDINSTIVNLLVKPLPVATISQGTPSTICEGQSTQVIFNGTAGAVVIYTINGGTPETITLNANVPTILPTGILNETTVYELVSVTYTGANACSQNVTGSATVTVNPLPTVTLEDGFICVDPVTLATTRTYRLDTELNDAEFTFEWFDQNGPITSQTYSYYDVSEVGQYGVTITNIITGCQSSAFANVDQSSPPTDFDYTVNGFFANNPTVVITASPIGDYEYQLDFGPFQESNVFDNITAGTHTITVRDPQACDVLTKEVFIVDYPKYFTPNGDGVNDTWNIPSINTLSMSKIYIFDRFGKLVKQISASGSGWDGTYNGQPLPATDYWFTINYQEAGINKEFRAHFSLKR